MGEYQRLITGLLNAQEKKELAEKRDNGGNNVDSKRRTKGNAKGNGKAKAKAAMPCSNCS